MKAQLPFLCLLTLLFCACQNQQNCPDGLCVKHAQSLQLLFSPHATPEYPCIVHHWQHHNSHYYLRTGQKITNRPHDWCVEVRHPDGTCYRHSCPQPPFSKAAHRITSEQLRISYRHKGERLILTLHHINNAQVILHAHNLGYMESAEYTDAAATATLAQAVQQGGTISLYNEGRECQLTEWEQECLRRMLKGALATSPQQPSRRTLRFYSLGGNLLCEHPLSEYWPHNHWSDRPGIATLPDVVLPGNTLHRYLRNWWHIVSCRLQIHSHNQLQEGKIPRNDGNPITEGFITGGLRQGTGTISSQALEELLHTQ